MAYTPTEWKSGDVITSSKLNKLENGVAASGGGGSVVVLHVNESEQLDKTFSEVVESAQTGIVCLPFYYDGTYEYYTLVGATVEHGETNLCTLIFECGGAGSMQFTCADESEYPVYRS